MRRNFVTALVTGVMTASMAMTAFAAGPGWSMGNHGWWYPTNEAGTSWYANGWHWIDEDANGIEECYYFDADGYLLTDTVTPDGYTVNANGAWTVDGMVQTKAVAQIGEPATVPDDRVSQTGVYDSNGVSFTAIDMLYSTREANAIKYAEVDSSTLGNQICVEYSNGFSVIYPGDANAAKTVSVTDREYGRLFQHFDASIGNVNDALTHLRNHGFVNGRNGVSNKGGTCVIQCGEDFSLTWSGFGNGMGSNIVLK